MPLGVPKAACSGGHAVVTSLQATPLRQKVAKIILSPIVPKFQPPNLAQLLFKHAYKSPQYYTILYYTILYYTILYYTILYYTILYYTILCYTILGYTILYGSILRYIYSTIACDSVSNQDRSPSPRGPRAPDLPAAAGGSAARPGPGCPGVPKAPH